MADGAVFTLDANLLGANELDEVHLSASFRAVLDALAGGALFDLLDADGERIPFPADPGEFIRPVEAFDVPPEAPVALMVYDDGLAQRVAEAWPSLPRAPRRAAEGVAFELGAAQLALDPFGLAHLSGPVLAALAAARAAAPGSRARLFTADGEAVRDRPTSFAEQLVPLSEQAVSELTGIEPHWLVLPDAAAGAFIHALPGLACYPLAELEALWRRARRGEE